MTLRPHLAIASLILLAGVSAPAPAAPRPADQLVYVGTHGSGPGQGIWVLRFDGRTGTLGPATLAVEVERPTWQAVDPDGPLLYSVSETGNDGKSQGGVLSYAIDPSTGALRRVGQVGSGGGGATYLSLDARAHLLFVANYGTGQVAVIPAAPDGALSPASSVQSDSGSGPTKRQAGPHAHAAVVDPSGRYLLVPDLGADRLFVYRINAARQTITPAPMPFIAFPPGSGPRHLAFSADGRFAFVDTELTGEIVTFRWDAADGRLEQVGRIAIDPPGYQGIRSAAEIALSADGRFLYVSTRGENQIVVYAVDKRSGALSEQQRVASGGTTPWSFAIAPSGRWMIVANEASSTLSQFKVNRADGHLTMRLAVAVPKPVSIAFLPLPTRGRASEK